MAACLPSPAAVIPNALTDGTSIGAGFFVSPVWQSGPSVHAACLNELTAPKCKKNGIGRGSVR